jgi:AcrR family transcriptional regulator
LAGLCCPSNDEAKTQRIANGNIAYSKIEGVKKQRPGGRTAQNQAKVFEAAAALTIEREPATITFADVAARAGVAATSLYRRWSDIGLLLLEVVVDQLNRERPLPDSGSLAGDLRTWARRITSDLRSKKGSAIFKVIVASAARGQPRDGARARLMEPRLKQIETLLKRASERGEWVPTAMDIVDHLLAPLYVRALFGAPGDRRFAEGLVDHLLRTLSEPEANEKTG